MIPRSTTIYALVGVVAATALANSSRVPKLPVQEERVIVAAVLQSGLGQFSARKPRLRSTTSIGLARSSYPSWDAFASDLKVGSENDPQLQSAIDNFLRNNRVEARVTITQAGSRSIDLVSSTDADAEIAASRSSADQRYDMYEVSRPGLSTNGKLAVIAVSCSSAPASVWGRFFVLRFKGKKWRIDHGAFIGPKWLSQSRAAHPSLPRVHAVQPRHLTRRCS